ncbi:probable indole-3-pyruvate monooxygenase YUCCA11 isoform X2 [Lycium barbarum]|uniref:probable indole-3-pyruvate monooxygenase YUCCA11 isoform X2 n=1 Tax=Lycium barbarum TaxID=112863 RepID=UPI00293EABD4|nr:probable indole-3-pyruvate monooxygenase YUCCA11 isoform X2 [Lycium barbarum]XP_060179687.1 probable indole-3-pyruvate monooxygenase YUCCA11 isoform X2 [Lycium barbarum]XP_060179688.1 probable indole-3-pyruvate monooxygenase YUCCA11 isoform X2 [Lycium barbarum]
MQLVVPLCCSLSSHGSWCSLPEVKSAYFDNVDGKWHVKAMNVEKNVAEYYVARILVVATGENSEGFVPIIEGLDDFGGMIMHSSDYGNGKSFEEKEVLVVGCGNSGMEIAYDLSNWGARTSIIVHKPVHVLTKKMVHIGLLLLKYIPCDTVDKMMIMLSKLTYGDLSVFGINSPNKGPFYLKNASGRSPVIDVGTVDKIKEGKIKVLPSIKKIKKSYVEFTDGKRKRFDALIFATGYKSTVMKWLKDDGVLFNENGMPKKRSPYHWKGEKGIYCVGFASAGLFGISSDAKNIAEDIDRILMHVGGEMDLSQEYC